jgi:hypothetical protein
LALTVFISHSTKDTEIVYTLYGILKQVGATVHVSERLVTPGLEIQDKIRSLIASSDVVVAVLSAEGAKSQWVNWELGTANALNKPIIPVLGEGVEAPRSLEGREYIRVSRTNPSIAYQNLASYVQRLKTEKERNEALVAVAILLGIVFLGLASSK